MRVVYEHVHVHGGISTLNICLILRARERCNNVWRVYHTSMHELHQHMALCMAMSATHSSMHAHAHEDSG